MVVVVVTFERLSALCPAQHSARLLLEADDGSVTGLSWRTGFSTHLSFFSVVLIVPMSDQLSLCLCCALTSDLHFKFIVDNYLQFYNTKLSICSIFQITVLKIWKYVRYICLALVVFIPLCCFPPVLSDNMFCALLERTLWPSSGHCLPNRPAAGAVCCFRVRLSAGFWCVCVCMCVCVVGGPIECRRVRLW